MFGVALTDHKFYHGSLIIQLAMTAILLTMAAIVRWQEAGRYDRGLLGIVFLWLQVDLVIQIWPTPPSGVWGANLGTTFVASNVGLLIGTGIWLKAHKAN